MVDFLVENWEQNRLGVSVRGVPALPSGVSSQKNPRSTLLPSISGDTSSLVVASEGARGESHGNDQTLLYVCRPICIWIYIYISRFDGLD